MANLDRAFSSATSDASLQTTINEYLRRDGFQQNGVVGLRFRFQREVSPAFGFGVKLPAILGFPEFPIGTVFISDIYYTTLPDEELEFVVLHELGHIVNSHSVNNLIVYGVKRILISWFADILEIPQTQVENIIGFLKWLYTASGQRTIEEEITAQKELEADRYAVTLQGRREPAISVLTKINNQNIDAPTHVTVDGVFVTPAINARERIEAIRNLPIW